MGGLLGEGVRVGGSVGGVRGLGFFLFSQHILSDTEVPRAKHVLWQVNVVPSLLSAFCILVRTHGERNFVHFRSSEVLSTRPKSLSPLWNICVCLGRCMYMCVS